MSEISIIKRLSGLLVFTLFIGFTLNGCLLNEIANKEKNKELKIGISVYKQEDKFITCLVNSLEEYVVKKENDTNTKITVNIVDAKGNTTTQNNQIDKFIIQEYDVICINIVDRTAAAMIINKAKKADIPVVFFNREPVEEDMNLWDRVYYVGAKADESGYMQGKIIVDEYNKNNSSVDKNKDGKIQYVMLEGEPEHQDSLIRTETTIKTLINNGIEVDKLADDSANWQYAQAYEKMMQWINEFGSKIEVVFSNNDDMALGAIYALENSNIELKDRPLVMGIDGIPEALKRIKDGTMKGTVFNNYQAQAEEIINICYDTYFLLESEDIRCYKASYKIITGDNVDEYLD